MRTKDEILESTREDIKGWLDPNSPGLWMEYRKIEVLIDIRDIIELRFCQLIDRVTALVDKD